MLLVRVGNYIWYSGGEGTLRRVMGWDTAFGFSNDGKSHPIGSKVTRKTLMWLMARFLKLSGHWTFAIH